MVELMEKRIREYIFESPGADLIPRIYPPVGSGQLAEVALCARQDLEVGYREFLSLTGGMDGFYPGMRILGIEDLLAGVNECPASGLVDTLKEADTPLDVGLPPDINIFPVAIDRDSSAGVFMIDAPDVLPERFWWVGEGTSLFFNSFSDFLSYVINPGSIFPRSDIE
nr:hypothetical protein [Streptomyces sp. ST1020]